MRTALSLFAAVAISFCLARGSQSEPNLPQVGILLAVSPNIFSEPLQTFRQVLKEHGFVEDQTLKISARYAPENLDQLRASAAELVSLSPNVILTAATTATQAAKDATSTIPIVFVLAGDPVGTGFVARLE